MFYWIGILILIQSVYLYFFGLLESDEEKEVILGTSTPRQMLFHLSMLIHLVWFVTGLFYHETPLELASFWVLVIASLGPVVFHLVLYIDIPRWQIILINTVRLCFLFNIIYNHFNP